MLSRSVSQILKRYQEKLINVELDKLDPYNRCVDVRPVHTGALPTLKERIQTMGYLLHQRVVVILNDMLRYVVVDGRHRVICVKQLKEEGKFHANTLPAILLDDMTPEYLQFRLATGK